MKLSELKLPLKVRFKKEIFADDFVEKGMVAWLTIIQQAEDYGPNCYKLYFDFTEFEDYNLKFFTDSYFPNIHTQQLKYKPLYTAIEAGCYTPKHSVYYDESDQDPLENYLELMED